MATTTSVGATGGSTGASGGTLEGLNDANAKAEAAQFGMMIAKTKHDTVMAMLENMAKSTDGYIR